MIRRCFIIGGGPSIESSLLQRLSDEFTIAINKSVFYVPNPKLFFTIDYTVLKKIDMTKVRCQKFFVVCSDLLRLDDGIWHDPKHGIRYEDLNREFDVIIKSRKGDGIGTSFEEFRHGYNSALAALQLVLLLNFEEINLVGIDLKTVRDKTHFHGGYGESQKRFEKKLNFYYQKWEKALIETKEKFPHVKIYSLSPISHLNKFIPYKCLE